MLDRIRKHIRYIRRKIRSLDPYDIASYKRIPIIHTYDLPEGILGMFVPVGAKGVIYLKPDMPHEQERFVLFHELFHLLFKHQGAALTSQEDMYNPNWVRLSKQEHEAHMGATSVILDQYKFTEYINIVDISRETGCPEKMVKRWVQLGGLGKASKKRH
jgi:Zn-dependent peptidase ImmA (M78 family)